MGSVLASKRRPGFHDFQRKPVAAVESNKGPEAWRNESVIRVVFEGLQGRFGAVFTTIIADLSATVARAVRHFDPDA